MGIGDEFQEGLTNVTNLIGENPLAAVGVAAGTGAVLGAGTAVAITGIAKKKKKSSKKKIKKSKKRSTKKRKSKLKFGSRAYRKKYLTSKRKRRSSPRTAGKGRDKSSKRIRYTKKGQPYIIMHNGRARFIKKSGARRSHKLKGGRY